jgi:putative acetyltransferase
MTLTTAQQASKPVTHNDALTIRPYQPSDQPAFAALTHEWVTHHFGQLEPEDIAFSNDPDRYIIAPGGTIFMACLDGLVVGTVGIQKMDETTVELVRMSVTKGMQGHGIGKALLARAIEWSREQGFASVILETHSSLIPAITMYTRDGFTHYTPLPQHRSALARADVWMQLVL